jgi:hypothetical protein
MMKLSSILAVLVLAVIVGGAIFLSTWDLPPPSAKVEKAIPDEKFPH